MVMGTRQTPQVLKIGTFGENGKTRKRDDFQSGLLSLELIKIVPEYNRGNIKKQ